MRLWIYLLAGITFAIVGWNLGQFFLTEAHLRELISTEPVMLPCVALSLAGGLFFTEIFLSSPTRLQQSFKRAKIPLIIAVVLGFFIGLVAGGIYLLIDLPRIRSLLHLNDGGVRLIGWILVSLAVSLSEALAWWRLSLEAKDEQRFKIRLIVSIVSSLIAAIIASRFFEWLRYIKLLEEIKRLEDPIGLMILGACLGIAFALYTSPSYIAALRAGAGFEYMGDNLTKGRIDDLYFVGKFNKSKIKRIDEGLSIQLPNKGEISIGSGENAHIKLDNLPEEIATIKLIKLDKIKAWLYPHEEHYNKIFINGVQCLDDEEKALKHNTIITFYCDDNSNFYRFVYYNRFLDPLS